MPLQSIRAHFSAFEHHTVIQNWLQKSKKPKPYLNPLDYHVWETMMEKYHKLQPKPKPTEQLKAACSQTIWEEMSHSICYSYGT